MGERMVRWMPHVLVAALMAWVAARAIRPINDPDDWWHLRLGNDLIDQHSLSTPAHWSAFATVGWVPTEPLPEIVGALVDRWWGLPGLAVLYAIGGCAVVVAVYVACRRFASPLPSAVVCVLTVLAASASLTSRPQLVSFVLLPLVVRAWMRAEADHRPRWLLVPLFWLWSLCHGFWFLGAGYGVLFVVGFALGRTMPVRVVLRHGGVALASIVVVALNPVGLGVLQAPLRVNDTAQYIQEWARADLTSPAALGAAAMVTATAAIWSVTRQQVTWARLLVLASAVFWTWYAGRTVAVAGLVLAPVLASALEHVVRAERLGASHDTASTPTPRQRGIGDVEVVAGLAVLAVLVVALAAPHTADRPGDVPTGLDTALDRLPAGTRVFNAYELGGWIAWRHPDLEQYIDGLITPYSAAHARDYVVAEATKPGWYRIVQASGAGVALLSRRSALAAGLRGRGWRLEGSDAGYVLLFPPP